MIPDLTRSGAQTAWYLLETAKRRLIYNLKQLQLPLADKRTDLIDGLAFEFLADPDDPTAPRVLTTARERQLCAERGERVVTDNNRGHRTLSREIGRCVYHVELR